MDQPKLLWQPSTEFRDKSNLSGYRKWLAESKNISFVDYHALWIWSTEYIEAFWKSIWEYFDLEGSLEAIEICSRDSMPGVKWFEGTQLNYAREVFRNRNNEYPALIFASEKSSIVEISWTELIEKTASLQAHLEKAGLKSGDRVAAFLPNIPEAIISFLAVNSIGAVWSSCSPDFGLGAVTDRFTQIEPKILITVDGYQYAGKSYDKKDVINDLISKLPSLEQIIYIPYLDDSAYNFAVNTSQWESVISESKQSLKFSETGFSHPIWVLFSSGTTGVPKAITHSNGGIILEHLKYLSFHNNIKAGDRCFWYTTTGWMMWNYIIGSLLVKGTTVLYDGSPAYPDMNVLWKFAEQAKITHFGTSAGFVIANMKAATRPGNNFNLNQLISIGSTGSPLPPEGFDWLYKNVKSDLWVASISGGTDVCSAFVGGNPLLPVHSGEIQCRALGCKLEAFDDEGRSIINQVGEMVLTKPMPSMPIYFWGDENFAKYTESYFEMYPGIWRHGDWTMITERNGIIIYGRSDSTLNRGGVRIGTSEIYRAVDKVDEISDSLIICIENNVGDFYMPLFVTVRQGAKLDEILKNKIKTTIRSEYTPRHVPDEIIEITEVPYTISGKKVETPVKKILQGKPFEKILNKDALKNPAALDFFIEYAKKLKFHQ